MASLEVGKAVQKTGAALASAFLSLKHTQHLNEGWDNDHLQQVCVAFSVLGKKK